MRARSWIAAAAAVLALASAAYPAVVGWKFSSALIHPAPFAVADAPEHYHLRYAPVAIHSTRVASPLTGWLISPLRPDDRAVLFLHGWRSHKRHMLKDYLSWLGKRYTVLAFDHPGHGDGPPGPTTLGPGEIEDARAALGVLRERGFKRLAVFGASMGGTTALGLAATEPAVRAVVSDATFARPEDITLGYFKHHGFWFPPLLAASTIGLVAARTGADYGGRSAIEAIAQLGERPVYLIHGMADHVILPENADRLYAAASGPKTLWKVPGADHLSEDGRGPHAVAPAEYERRVTGFLDAAMQTGGPKAAR